MRGRFVLAPLGLLALACLPRAQGRSEHVGLGPIDLTSQGPLQALRLGLRPTAPRTLPEGGWRLSVRETLANVFAVTGSSQVIDFEMLQTRVLLAYGLGEDMEVEIGYQDRSRFGGILDRFVIEFHELFGIDQNARDRFDERRNLFSLAAEGDNPAFDLGDESGALSRDLLLTLHHDLSNRWRLLPAFSYSVSSRLNLGGRNGLNGDIPLDLGLNAALARALGAGFHLYLNLAYTWYGEDRFGDIELRRTQYAGLLACEWRATRNVSLLGSYLVSEGTTEDRKIHSRATHEIGLGLKARLSARTTFELGLLDDIVEHNNSPDFGFHFGLEFAF